MDLLGDGLCDRHVARLARALQRDGAYEAEPCRRAAPLGGQCRLGADYVEVTPCGERDCRDSAD